MKTLEELNALPDEELRVMLAKLDGHEKQVRCDVCDAAREDAERLADAIKHSDRFNDTRHFGGDAQLKAALAAHEAIAKN